MNENKEVSADKEDFELIKLALEVEDLREKKHNASYQRMILRLSIVGFYGAIGAFILNFFQPAIHSWLGITGGV